MRRVRVLLRSHPLVGLGLVCVGLAAAWIAIAETVSDYPPGTVEIGDIYDLGKWFRDQQLKWLPIMPPTDDPFIQTGYPGVLPFDPVQFPAACKAGLLGDIEYGAPVYDLYLLEDPDTRRFVIYNADLEEVCSLAAPAGYDPAAFVEAKYPDLYSRDYSAAQRAWLLDLYDPARIQIAARLVPAEFFDTYNAAKESAAYFASMSLGGMSMMMGGSGSTRTGIWVSAEATVTGATEEVEVTVHLPTGFSDRIDVFKCEDQPYAGFASAWTMIASNLSAGGQDTVGWTDTDVTNDTFKAYTAGNADADTDGDWLADARELFIYKTEADDPDTDGDGLWDGWELSYMLDPLDDGSTNAINGANGDPDGDGVINLHEFLLGRSPRAGVDTSEVATVGLVVYSPVSD